MSSPSVAAYNEHYLHEDTMSLKEPDALGPVHNKRWGVLVETSPDAEPVDARRGAAKSWHWGRSWKRFVPETFNNNNPKHATQPPLPTPPAAAGQSPVGDIGSRRISLTRSNAVHRPRSRQASSTLGIHCQAERPPYEQDPDSPTPSMTSGESNADTPVDSPLSQSRDHFTVCPEPSDRPKAPWEFDELFFHAAAEDLKPLPPVPNEPGHAVDGTGRVAAPAQTGSEPASRDIFDDTNRVTIPAKTEIETVTSTTNGNIDELLARIRSLEAELRERTDSLERKTALVNDIANSLERRDALVHDIINSLGPTGQAWGNDEPLAVAARVGRRMNEANSFLQSVDGALTQRNILMLKYVQRQGDTAAPASAIETVPTSPATPGILSMPSANLDSAMTLAQAAEYAASLDTRQTLGASGTLSVKLCRICRIPKFLNAPVYPWMFSPLSSKHDRQTACEVNEFFSATGVTTCCAKSVCKNCYVAGLVAGAATDWWHDLGPERPLDGRLDWLRCPMPTCSRLLGQQAQTSGPHPPREPLGALIASRLMDLGGADLTMHVFRFERACKLRASLEALTPRPTPEALTLAAKLHADLVRQGRMRHLFTTSISEADMAPRLLPFDSEDGASTLRAPLFAGFLVSPSTPRESFLFAGASGGGGGSMRHTTRDCSICCEAVRDAADGTPEDEARWAAAARAFPGAWAVSARAFPTAAALPACAARHALDVCRGCLARHVSTQLEARGRDVAGRLACPAPGCGHVYSHDEVRSLLLPNVLSAADGGDGDGDGEELFARYDRLCLLNHLSDIPGFMWCLREGCDNGQIHDTVPLDDDDEDDRTSRWGHAARHKVLCESCSFAMCARHQSAWHEGLTCREWDELRAAEGDADPAEAASRRWIAANTKRCPGDGCGAPVEKGEGCFHMTCRRCSFEFCWECLADWSEINRARSRPAVQGGGHNVGCFFREPGAPMPTAIRGTSAREAARRAVR